MIIYHPKRHPTAKTMSNSENRLCDFSAMQEKLATTGTHWVEKLGEIVKRYPGGTAIVAFSLGVGLGWWIKRKM